MIKLPSPRPLSVKILAFAFLVGTVFAVISILDYTHFLVLTLTGLSARLINIGWSLLSAYATFGLWHVHKLARRIAIGMFLYLIVNNGLLIFRATTEGWAAAGAAELGYELPRSWLATYWTFLCFGVFLPVIGIWLLFRTKPAFATSPTLPT